MVIYRVKTWTEKSRDSAQQDILRPWLFLFTTMTVYDYCVVPGIIYVHDTHVPVLIQHADPCPLQQLGVLQCHSLRQARQSDAAADVRVQELLDRLIDRAKLPAYRRGDGDGGGDGHSGGDDDDDDEDDDDDDDDYDGDDGDDDGDDDGS